MEGIPYGPITELVKLGFLGFSTAILIFSFVLLYKVMTAPNLERQDVISRAQQIRGFMYLSLAVICIGLIWQLFESETGVARFFDPEIPVVIDVDPPDLDGVEVEVSDIIMDFAKTKRVTVRGNQEINIALHKIKDRLYELEHRLSSLEGMVAGLNQHKDALVEAQLEQAASGAEKERESGF